MSYTTLDHVTHVEGHDDLYRGHRSMFLESVLARSLPNTFHQFLKTWPNVQVKAKDWNEEQFTYKVTASYEHWTFEVEFDASSYYTDSKQAFCEKLDAFCRDLSEKFLAEENSGRPWWHNGKNIWALDAQLRIEERQFKRITTRLAEIRCRGGRYHWHLIPDKYKRNDWDVIEHKQGHSKTLDEAKAVCMAAWKAPK